MREHRQESKTRERHGHGLEQKLQVICLASGGGPSEDNVTGFLVRSISAKWSKGSVLAVDAGSHLSAITRLLEADFPRVSGVPPNDASNGVTTPRSAPNGKNAAVRSVSDHGYDTSDSSRASSPEPAVTVLDSGPFAGLTFPHESARANALYVVRECVSTYLITHPHLDHLSAFAINTAAFHNTSRPKRLAALPSTVNAIKTHIFNDVIWPNLTDEDGGVGFVTFQRLTDGGNLAVGTGPGKGYMEVCDGLCIKGMKISHGHCMRRAADPTLSRGSEVGLSDVPMFRSQHSSTQHHSESLSISPTKARRTPSLSHISVPGTPGASISGTHAAAPNDHTSREVVVDSTAFFIRDDSSGREILVFGDVEPDSLSLNPRTAAVWSEAAPKIASGHLRAVMIECSYDDSQGDNVLFGHLAPRHLIKELTMLTDMVKRRRREHRERRNSRKRKRSSHPRNDITSAATLEVPGANTAADQANAGSRLVSDDEQIDGNVSKRGRMKHRPTRLSTASGSVDATPDRAMSPLARHDASAYADDVEDNTIPPLAGLTVIVIHVKDTLKDGPLVGDTILRQLREHEARVKESDGVGLGCEFVVSRVGESYSF